MTTTELIEKLKMFPPETKVRVWFGACDASLYAVVGPNGREVEVMTDQD